jgi:hypothetical protein
MKGFERDGAKWGVSDFYDEARESLLEALKSGEDFDTGYYGVKKEIQTGRVYRLGTTIYCEAWCSDDFDTEGHGDYEITVFDDDTAEQLLEQIENGLEHAADGAESDRKDNQVYQGWAVGRVAEDGSRKDYWYTYIQPVGDGSYMDYPPGDNYHWWGWDDQDPEEDRDYHIPRTGEDQVEFNVTQYPELPDHVRKAFEEFAEGGSGDTMTLDGWRIDRWKD